MLPFNRGRGRGNSRGRGRGNYMLNYQEQSVPLLGDISAYQRQQQQSTATNPKKDIPSSSSSENLSYKDAAANEAVKEIEQEYFENPITELILYIEEEDVQMHLNDGWSIKTRYLATRGYAGLNSKARPNLELLLTVTESVTITHHRHQNDPNGFINYSKCHINKILTPKEWNLDPNSDKSIKIAEGKNLYFNYWDYVEAFSKAFYYQNPKNKHSWFFTINPGIVNKPVPNWFLEWWSKFGPSLEILPKEIMDQYDPWCDTSPLILKYSPDKLIFGQCPFLFFAKFQIPWIWRWTISVNQDKLNIPIIQRNFFCKWWRSMTTEDIGKIVAQIIATTKSDKEKGSKEHFSAVNLKSYFQKKFPKASDEEIMVKILDYMKAQFCTAYSSQSKDEDMKSMSSHGSQDSYNPYNCLAGEGQEDEGTPTLEDAWDAMIATMMTQQVSKDKGKSPMQ